MKKPEVAACEGLFAAARAQTDEIRHVERLLTDAAARGGPGVGAARPFLSAAVRRLQAHHADVGAAIAELGRAVAQVPDGDGDGDGADAGERRGRRAAADRKKLNLLKCVWVGVAPVRCLRSRGTASR